MIEGGGKAITIDRIDFADIWLDYKTSRYYYPALILDTLAAKYEERPNQRRSAPLSPRYVWWSP